MTNNHVIEGADEITVHLQDNTEYKAKLIGRDPKTDLALLKVDAPKPLPFVEWGDSDKARIGDWVIAIGNPFGLGGTVTAGIVSARNRDINAGPYDDFIQTDAADQPRQFRRPDVRHGRQCHRHQYRDLLALRRQHRHRLRLAVLPGQGASSPSFANTAIPGAAGWACASRA